MFYGVQKCLSKKNPSMDIPKQLPILSLRNTVLFPYQVQPLAVGRKKSLKLLKQLDPTNKILGLVTQKDGSNENPTEEDMYRFGIVASIVKSFKMPDGSEHIIIQGMERIRITEFIQNDPHMIANVEVVKSDMDNPVHVEALINNCKTLFAQIVEISPILSNEHLVTVKSEKDPSIIADIIASNLNMSVEEKQEILEIIPVKKRLEKIHLILNKEIQVLELENKIQTDVQGELNKNQREFVLKEQLKAIRRELGEIDDELDDLDELKAKLKKAKVPNHVEKVVKKELKRLAQMNQMAGEYSVVRNYLEWISDIPWAKKSKDKLDLRIAQKTMDDDHYGLESVKKRIIEYLAVKKIKSDIKGPILCLYGPPGVGKTSLGRSIAKSLNREFGRISLGGISDEAEIRGHRRTYIGAMPGRLVRELKKMEVNNPVIMLDEIDKIGRDFKGDPSSALLEVLDPEQNHTFVDNYIEVEIDLSQILFIATANRLDTIPPPLLDRMEVIDISGYIEEEKINIAENYLIPKQLLAHGLENKKIRFHKSAISQIINSYTKEAGVRGLEKSIASVVRYVATEFVMTKKIETIINKKIVETSLGTPKYESEVKERTSKAGVATGMAWTPYGGEILFIEATKMPGKGQLKLTGSLGDVMKESAQTAFSLLRSRSHEYGFPDDFYKDVDVHLHVPAGATPKDGPSAGITLFTALYSIFSGFKIRHNVAMTGEITLRGLVLPIGGLKEKVLAAKRAGISKIIAPARNQKDLDEIPKKHLKGLEFFFVKDIKDVVSFAINFRNTDLTILPSTTYKQLAFN